MNKNLGFWLYAVGAVTIVLATAAFVFFGAGFLVGWKLKLIMAMRWVMVGGVVLNIVGRVMTLPKNGDFRVKRLNNLMALSAVMLATAAFLIFAGNTYIGTVYVAKSSFIAFILISALIDLWVSFRMPNEKE